MRREEEICKCGHKRVWHVSRRGYFNMECEHQSSEMRWNYELDKKVKRFFKDCSCKKFTIKGVQE